MHLASIYTASHWPAAGQDNSSQAGPSAGDHSSPAFCLCLSLLPAPDTHTMTQCGLAVPAYGQKTEARLRPTLLTEEKSDISL